MSVKIQLPIEEIIEKRENGISQKDIAEVYGVSHSTISRLINAYYESKGKINPRKQNIELPIEEIIEKREKGISQKDIAELYGVSISTISKIIDRYYDDNSEKRKRVLKAVSLVKEYLKKGLAPEQIIEIAGKKQVIIPADIMQKAIEEVEQEKNKKDIEAIEK